MSDMCQAWSGDDAGVVKKSEMLTNFSVIVSAGNPLSTITP